MIIVLIFLIVIVGLLLYFNPYLDIYREKGELKWILWYNFKGNRYYIGNLD